MTQKIVLASRSGVRKKILDENNIKCEVMPADVDEDSIKESLLKEKNLQPIFFPSINKENYDKFIETYHKIFEEYPNQLSFLSYDLIGLVYYLALQNNFIIDKKMFLKKNMFKGKMGIFEVKDNKINHTLNFYKAEDNNFKKIF